jgi:ribosomal protein S18 acetylase RimI-like enzyme
MNITGKLRSLSQASPAIISLDQEYFPHPWQQQQWMELNLSQHLLFSWEVDSRTIGLALLGSLPGDNVAHLYKILIHPAFQKQRQAQAFWSGICQELKARGFSTVYLEVAASNPKAISFYQNSGFVLLRTVRAYYSNGEDGLMMELTL